MRIITDKEQVMYNPPHPGRLLKNSALPNLNLTVSAAAKQLGVSRGHLSRVVNGRAAVTPELALRLEKWLPGPRASTWLKMQAAHDLWQVEQTLSAEDWQITPVVVPAHDSAMALAELH